MRSVLKNEAIAEGTLVSFTVTMGAEGPQAAELNVLPAGVIGSNGRSGTTLNGTIKSFDDQKGFGSKDIFLHRRELSGQTPSVGDSVQVVLLLLVDLFSLVLIGFLRFLCPESSPLPPENMIISNPLFTYKRFPGVFPRVPLPQVPLQKKTAFNPQL